MINCIAESNGAFGFNGTSLGTTLSYCASYNNTSGRSTGTLASDFAGVTGTSSFFTNAAGGDFSLNATAGGGAAARAAGYPGVFPADLTTGYLDIGAAQHADPASGGGGYVPQVFE
jgi:hypothetical protein